MRNSISQTSLMSTDEEVLTCVKDFKVQFKTEADCFEKLCEIKGIELVCKHCGNDNIDREYGNRNFVCGVCRKKNWVTAGSFFDHVRRPSAWLLFIFLHENGININSCRFSRLAGIATSTAQVIYRKVCIVIEEAMSVDMPSVSSREFFGVFGKRSRLTPANNHPVSEQLEVDQVEQKDIDSDLPIDYPGLTAEQSRILQFIHETPVYIDTLSEKTRLPVEEVTSALVMLEIDNLVVSKPGARYVRTSSCRLLAKPDKKNNCLKPFAKVVNSIIAFITCEFHRVSRKYVQLYIAAIWCQKATHMWSEGKLLQVCQRSKKISRARLRDYNSLSDIKIWQV